VKKFTLASSAINKDYQLSFFDEIGSTNSEALKAAKIGAKGKHWFVSDNQISGRGRMGREWFSSKGNLAASLLLTTDLSPKTCSTLGFVAGVAAYRAIEQSRVGSKILLKWPNDILADGAKILGIMLESQLLPNNNQAIVIGFGVNIVDAPKDMPYATSCLFDIGSSYDAKDFFNSLSNHWLEIYQIWNNGNGIKKVLEIWKKNAAGIGQEIHISNHGKTISGIFKDIDENGRLVVKTNIGKIEYISAGDVHFGSATSKRSYNGKA